MEQPVEPARDSGPTETNFVRLGLLFYAALAAAGGVWRIGFYDEPILFTSVAAQAEELSLGRDLLIGVAAAAALIALSDWATLKTRWGEDLARAMARALGPLSVSNAVLLALVSGFAEEGFFRGALQPRVGWLLASLLFGCVHFVPRREFLPWTGIPDLATAWRIVESAARENAGILLDTWHWQRQPGGPAVDVLRGIPGDRIPVLQVCDCRPEPEGDPL